MMPQHLSPPSSAMNGSLYAVLPRILSFFDRDRTADTYGVGDRQHVSWCTTDFANGTYQGAAFGLARLWAAGLLPDWCGADSVRAVITSAFAGAATIRRADGSMEEAFPYEGSFCVTALVVHDLLQAYVILKNASGTDSPGLLQKIEPMVGFLLRRDESHGIISNHLATAAGALFLWHSLTGDRAAETRGHYFLARIRRHYSAEGWFEEYGGADPGYQTLCLHYLALLHDLRPDLELRKELLPAIGFLTHFALPDGSFGGVYGSRRTRLFFPSGFALLAGECPEAATLLRFMQTAMVKRRCVTLECMDDVNLIPMFNAYAVASTTPVRQTDAKLPCENPQFYQADFPEAGLCVRADWQSYTVVSTLLGGAFETALRDGSMRRVNGGSLLRGKGTVWSTQGKDPEAELHCDAGCIDITLRPSKVLRRRPTILSLMLLRVLAGTVMRLPAASLAIKRVLAHMLIERHSYAPVRIRRTIRFGDSLAFCEASTEGAIPAGFEFVQDGGDFRSIHMASAGYWQSGEPS